LFVCLSADSLPSGHIESAPETGDFVGLKMQRPGVQWTPSLMNPFASVVDAARPASSCRAELQRADQRSSSSSSQCVAPFVRHSDGVAGFPSGSGGQQYVTPSSDLGSLLAWGRGPELQSSQVPDQPAPAGASPFIDFLGVGGV
jgi:hypothetical protein